MMLNYPKIVQQVERFNNARHDVVNEMIRDDSQRIKYVHEEDQMERKIKLELAERDEKNRRDRQFLAKLARTDSILFLCEIGMDPNNERPEKQEMPDLIEEKREWERARARAYRLRKKFEREFKREDLERQIQYDTASDAFDAKMKELKA